MDYDYIKNLYRLIEVDLSRQRELDSDSKAAKQKEFVGQLPNACGVNTNTDGKQSMFVLTILDENQRNETKIVSTKYNSLIKNGRLWRSKS